MNPNKTVPKLSVFIVLLTLMVLSCSGVSDIPSLFATETPTPTVTYTPSPTFTPSPTPTETQTPSPTPRPTGIDIEEQSDGTALFIDYDNRYQLVLPEDWLVIPFKKSAYAEAINKLAKNNPQLAAAAEAFKDMDPSVFRLVAINTNSKYTKNTFASNMNITAYEDEIMGVMPLGFVMGALEEQFKQNGVKVLTEGVNLLENSHGVDIEYIQTEQSVNGIKFQQHILVFQANGKLIMIAITTLPQFAKDVFAEGDVIGASVEVLK